MKSTNDKKNNTIVETELLKRDKPARPQCLRIKTKQSYDVKLPTYEESQAKYGKFLCALKNADEKLN